MKSNLVFQTDPIGIALEVHEVSVRVAGGTVTPHRVNLQVVSVGGAKVSRIQRLSEQIATALDASPPPLG